MGRRRSRSRAFTSGTVDRAIPSCDLTSGGPPTLIARKHPTLTQPCLNLEGMRLTWQSRGGCCTASAAAAIETVEVVRGDCFQGCLASCRIFRLKHLSNTLIGTNVV